MRASRSARLRIAAAAGMSLMLLTGCVPAAQQPSPAPSEAPIGPVAPGTGSLGIAEVVGIVNGEDAPPTAVFSPGNAPSVSGEDLATERDYWIAVGGRPDECADVVSAPYLVSSSDTGARLDDPSALIGTFTEIDEERFGLIQLYAREFDDAATAAGFLAEFSAAVAACPGYQLVDGDTVTWEARRLAVAPYDAAPAGVAGLGYVETLSRSSAEQVTTTFLQRGGVVVSVYTELTSTSAMTAADAERITAEVAGRLGDL